MCFQTPSNIHSKARKRPPHSSAIDCRDSSRSRDHLSTTEAKNDVGEQHYYPKNTLFFATCNKALTTSCHNIPRSSSVFITHTDTDTTRYHRAVTHGRFPFATQNEQRTPLSKAYFLSFFAYRTYFDLITLIHLSEILPLYHSEGDYNTNKGSHGTHKAIPTWLCFRPDVCVYIYIFKPNETKQNHPSFHKRSNDDETCTHMLRTRFGPCREVQLETMHCFFSINSEATIRPTY